MAVISRPSDNTSVAHFIPALDRHRPCGARSSAAQDTGFEQPTKNANSIIFGPYCRRQRMILTSSLAIDLGNSTWRVTQIWHDLFTLEQLCGAPDPLLLIDPGLLRSSTRGGPESWWLRYLLAKVRHVWRLTQTEVNLGATAVPLKSLNQLPNAITGES